MSKPTTSTFNKAVARSFAPLAGDAKLAIQQLGDGIYEVPGKDFTMRIRMGTGHRKDILVTMLPTAERPADNDDLCKEIGLGVVAEFAGASLTELPIETEEEYLHSADYLAAAADTLLLPYLLGTRNDFAELKRFVAARSAKAVGEIPDYRFPKNVRKEWT